MGNRASPAKFPLGLHKNISYHCYVRGKKNKMPREVDATLRRSEFVEAAWRVIRREGLSAATLRRVASEVSFTTGALTHYFSNRQALLVQALRAAHFTAGARMMEAARKVKGD